MGEAGPMCWGMEILRPIGKDWVWISMCTCVVGKDSRSQVLGEGW